MGLFMKRFMRVLVLASVTWSMSTHLCGMILISKKSIIECFKCFSLANMPQSIGFEIIKHITLTEISKALEESIVSLYPEALCSELLNSYHTISTFNKNIMPSDKDLSDLLAYICKKEKINLIEFADIDGNTILHCFNMGETKKIKYPIISKAIHGVLRAAGSNSELLIHKNNIFKHDTLHIAARSKRLDVIKSIFCMPELNTEKIALSKDNAGNTILHAAVCYNHIATMKKLLSFPGINAQKLAMACNNQLKTALHCLIKNKDHKGTMTLLCTPHINVEKLILAKDIMGYTVLHYVVLINDVVSLNLIADLPGIDNNKVVTAQDNGGKTALHIAAKTRNVKMLKALLDIPGISTDTLVRIKDSRGYTVFDCFYTNDQSAIINILKPFM